MRLSIVAFMLLLAGCSHVVNVEKTTEYKCGDKIVLVEYLDDESVVVKINGVNTVLSRSETDSGERFDNSDSKTTLIRKSNDSVYLSTEGAVYPKCLEIKR